MAKVCMGCFESYGNDIAYLESIRDESGVYQICPKRSCGGEILDIDDMILPAVMLLNQKGYYTMSSCSGHLEDPLPIVQISFDRFVDDLPNIPPGFKMTKSVGETGAKMITISKAVMESNSVKLLQSIMSTCLQAYAWATQLPYLEDDTDIEAMFFGELGIFGDFSFDYDDEEDEESPFNSKELKDEINSKTISFDDFVNLTNKKKKD